jgi:hypothetical protein
MGQLPALQFYYGHYVKERMDTLSAAADGGHLEGLLHAHECGCCLEQVTLRDASQRQERGCLHYAHKHGCSILPDTPTNILVKDLQQRDCVREAKEDLCLGAEVEPYVDYNCDL